MTEKKELILRLPDDMFTVIKRFKKKYGVSYTNFIYNAIVWYCASKGLISINYLEVLKKNEQAKNR